MNSKTRVLVVDDELSYCEGLKVALGAEGFVVDVAADGEQALSIFDARNPDLVLLDVMMPRLSGLDVCRRIRAKSDVPVIMVSARKDEVDTVVGLEVGADDYIAKPYRLRELIARIRTVIRRAGVRQAQSEQVSKLQVGDVVLDRDRHSVKVLGKEVELPLKEFELLALLMQHAGFVVTRQRLIDRVWGFDYVGNTKTLDVHIRRLRSRIENDPSEPELIVTIRGLGYKYVASQGH
ncbi:MAG: response regulator transcription factor [Acidimicrobiaceae bacterium]|nr:response regulator transcription factor [Acidimicrobiaceae bacterium]